MYIWKKRICQKNCVHCPFRDYEDVCILQDEEANSVANNWDDLKRGCPLISLRAQQEAEKNEPLTLDEMRKMWQTLLACWVAKRKPSASLEYP